MVTRAEDVAAGIAAIYNAAADTYDDPANGFRERFARRAVEALHLRSGDCVLDVCCGSGTAALAAAAIVKPQGFVIGVDLAGRLLSLAKAKARERSLFNAQFIVGDMLDLHLPEGEFDAVICVFGLFFAPDMARALRLLWERVRPGGKLAITTWGPRLFEPASSALRLAVKKERPDVPLPENYWQRIPDAAALRALFGTAMLPAPEVTEQSYRHRLAGPEDWWTAVLGSAYRAPLDALDEHTRERIRQDNLAFIRQSRTRSLEMNVVLALATKPA